jgi:hypothetical protein
MKIKQIKLEVHGWEVIKSQLTNKFSHSKKKINKSFRLKKSIHLTGEDEGEN